MPFLLTLNYSPSYFSVVFLYFFVEFGQVLVWWTFSIFFNFIWRQVELNNWFQQVWFETRTILDWPISSLCLNKGFLSYLFSINTITSELHSAEQRSRDIVLTLSRNSTGILISFLWGIQDVQNYTLKWKDIFITKAVIKFSENLQENCFLGCSFENVCKWACERVPFKKICRP